MKFKDIKLPQVTEFKVAELDLNSSITLLCDSVLLSVCQSLKVRRCTYSLHYFSSWNKSSYINVYWMEGKGSEGRRIKRWRGGKEGMRTRRQVRRGPTSCRKYLQLQQQKGQLILVEFKHKEWLRYLPIYIAISGKTGSRPALTAYCKSGNPTSDYRKNLGTSKKTPKSAHLKSPKLQGKAHTCAHTKNSCESRT